MRRRDFLGVGASLASLGSLSLSACDASPAIEGGFTGIGMARGHALRDGSWRGRVPDQSRRAGVVIAGGGIAGLAAARCLRLQGMDDFALLELEDTPGGNSRGTQIDGIGCPVGAHYLPVPGNNAHEVQDWLEELGLRRRVAGRWEYDEMHLCHSPQERLFFQKHWQEGLLPVQGVAASTLAQYRHFARRVEALRTQAAFSIPMWRTPAAPVQLELDATPFATWLAREGFDDAHLHWYLDYCCRDDYGADAAHVSAWAGIHYFASRHGFHAPGEDSPERDSVLTWPQGNAWLTHRLAAPLGERLQCAQVVTRIAETRHGVEIDAFDAASQSLVRWHAERCIVALPVFIAARVVENPPPVLRAAAAATRYAPWLVANLHLRTPLAASRPDAPPSWDNVLYGTAGLGYVDARHQSLDPTPGPTVLSWYRPLGPSSHDGTDTAESRRRMQELPWSAWRDSVLAELSAAHPDLPLQVARIDITRHGHAMAMPVPGLLRQASTWNTSGGRIAAGRLAFAHADWSGYSIFEEAFTRGHHAALPG